MSSRTPLPREAQGTSPAQHFPKALRWAVLTIGAMLIATPAMAGMPWDGAAAGVLSIFTSGLSRTIAIIVVIVAGLATMASKIAISTFVMIVGGIAVVFGAPAIVDYFITAVA